MDARTAIMINRPTFRPKISPKTDLRENLGVRSRLAKGWNNGLPLSYNACGEPESGLLAYLLPLGCAYKSRVESGRWLPFCLSAALERLQGGGGVDHPKQV